MPSIEMNAPKVRRMGRVTTAGTINACEGNLLHLGVGLGVGVGVGESMKTF